MIPASLPDLDGLDPEALKALVIAKHSESLEQHRELTSSTHQIEHLKLVIEKYRRMIFGRKSEKLTGELEQLEFRLEELETAQAAEEAAQPQPKQRNPLRRELIRSVDLALHASLCPTIFRVRWSPIFPRTTAVPIAAVRCGSSVKTSPSNWSVFPPPSR
jgi:hypothetical protein